MKAVLFTIGKIGLFLLMAGATGLVQAQELQWALRISVKGGTYKEGCTTYYNKDGEWGIIDTQGRILVPATWDYIHDYENGLAIAKTEKGLRGVIDRSGQCVVPPVFDFIERLNEDYFVVSKGDKCGVMNGEGKTLLPVEYDRIDDETIADDVMTVSRGDKYGLVDGDFNIILPVEYDDVELSYDDKEFPIIEVKRDGVLYGFNRMTKQLMPQSFEYLSAEGSDFATVSLKKSDNSIVIDKWGNPLPKYVNQDTGTYAYKEEGKWGFKDKNGKVLIAPCFDYVSAYWHYSFVQVAKGKKWGVVNSVGKEIVPTKKDCHLTSFESDWDFAVIRQDSKYKVIDYNGKEVLPGRYDFVSRIPRYSGVFKLRKDGKNNTHKYGWTNVITGEMVEPEYDFSSQISPEYMVIEKGGMCALMRLPDCKVLTDLKYGRIEYMDGYFRVEGKTSEYGLIDAEGREIVPPVYDEVETPSEGLIYASKTVERGGKYVEDWALYDLKGNIVLDPSCGIELRTGFYEGVAFAIRRHEGRIYYGYVYNTLTRDLAEVSALGYAKPVPIPGTRSKAVDVERPVYDMEQASAESYFTWGLVNLENDNRTDEALYYFERALDLNPTLVGAWINKGVCHYRKGAYGKAVRAYKKAVELDPTNEQARSNLAAAQAARSQRNWAIMMTVSGVMVQTLNTAAAICNTAQPAVSSASTHRPAKASSSGSQGKEICSFCHGTGKNPAKERPAFYDYSSEDYSSHPCEICGSRSNHWHDDCPSCGGKGYR